LTSVRKAVPLHAILPHIIIPHLHTWQWGPHNPGGVSHHVCVGKMLNHLSGTAELQGHVAKKKPLLTPRHRELCLRFARGHSNWTWLDFANVLWTDESRLTLFQTDDPTFVRRRYGETLCQDCVVPTIKSGGGGIMMWGAMSYNGTAFLTKVNGHLNGAGYINILGNSAVPSAHLLGFGDNFGIQDDGVPCHRSQLLLNGKLKTT